MDWALSKNTDSHPCSRPPSWGTISNFLNSLWARGLSMTWGNQSHLLGEPPAGPGGTARPGYINALLVRNGKSPKGKPSWGKTKLKEWQP